MKEIPTAESPMFYKPKLHLLLHSLIFVLGFTLIFVIGWGGATTLLGGISLNIKIYYTSDVKCIEKAGIASKV